MIDLSYLSERELKILVLIVENYIAQGEPIGSRFLSKLENVGLSPASLRNIMTDLSAHQLLEQPHTSAGRIPTDKGYRAYVQYLSQLSKPNIEEIIFPKNLLGDDGELGIQKLLNEAIQFISEMTNLIGIVITPSPLNSKLNYIQFVPISEHQVMSLVVTKAGDVISRNIPVREIYEADVLNQWSDYLNLTFRKKLIRIIRNEFLTRISEGSEFPSDQMAHLIRLCKRSFEFDQFGELKLIGIKKIFYDYGNDFAEKSSDYLEFLEDKKVLARILYENSSNREVSIVIGEESNNKSLAPFAIVSAPYGMDNQTLGSIGVIGPRRIPYGYVSQIVNHTARELSRELEKI